MILAFVLHLYAVNLGIIFLAIVIIGAIIGYLSWPFMIWVSYILVRWALRYFEKQ